MFGVRVKKIYRPKNTCTKIQRSTKLLSFSDVWWLKQHCAARRQQDRRNTENVLRMKNSLSGGAVAPKPGAGNWALSMQAMFTDVCPPTLLHNPALSVAVPGWSECSLSSATLISHMTLALQVIAVPRESPQHIGDVGGN